MYRRGTRLIYSASDLHVFYESPFASWMDRFNADHRGVYTPDPRTAEADLVAAKGDAHERAYVARLKDEGRDVAEIAGDRKDFDALHEKTLAAMRAGREVVYQAALRDGDFEGHADFLVRVDRPSALGAFSYEVADTKLARSARPYFLIQLCTYAEMLARVQGILPEHVHVITGTGVAHEEEWVGRGARDSGVPATTSGRGDSSSGLSFRTEDYRYFHRSLVAAFRAAERAFDPERPPLPDPRADHGRWASHAEEILEDLDHPSRIAGITRVQVDRLAAAGLTTLAAIAEAEPRRVPKVDAAVVARLHAQARLQLASRGEARPAYEIVAHEPDMRRGLTLLPPPSPLDVYFDLEGYPFVEGGLEYLFGAVTEEGFQVLWAHDAEAERRAFEAFVDWAHARFELDPTMHVYHYAPYEVSALRRLMGRYGTREREVDTLLRAEVFVDLYRVVRQGVRIGEPRYSLKNVEHLYRPPREGDVASAGASLVAYARWLDTRDPALLEGIARYNQEDCESLRQLAGWLRARQVEAGIAWVPERHGAEVEVRDTPEKWAEAEALAERLLATLPEDPEERRIQELLAFLLGFHRREEKPFWWAYFDRQTMTEEELTDDPDCLGGLTRTDRAPWLDKRSMVFEYRFDPEQETTIEPGTCCAIAGTDDTVCVQALDAERGLVSLKQGLGRREPPARLSLIPKDRVGQEAIAASIYRTALAYAAGEPLPRALDDFLRRRPPRAGAPAQDPIDRIAHLDESALAVQGPPGAGKTYTGARAIVRLIREGRRVGITSTSHRAIGVMIRAVVEAAEELGVHLRAVKVGGDEDLSKLGVRMVENTTALELDGPAAPDLVGGTAWVFSHPKAQGRFDHLFVDEAGQVSLANLVAVAPAADNLVLLGDQMQLPQPIQGSHPGESGLSTLDYLLEGRATIPEEMGVFLPITQRLHPELCRFVSGAIYEGRLDHHPSTALRTVRFSMKEAGILFVPVEHEGNARASDEEVEVVKALVSELDPSKVLVVAPYNLQVRRLKAALPAGTRVGSVDKFQGQEAPVVIVSMGTSGGETSPRGIDFLMSPQRLNVAISRAQSLAIVVGSPGLAHTRVSSVAEMKLVNLFCRIVHEGAARPPPQACRTAFEGARSVAS